MGAASGRATKVREAKSAAWNGTHAWQPARDGRSPWIVSWYPGKGGRSAEVGSLPTVPSSPITPHEKSGVIVPSSTGGWTLVR